MPTKIEVSMPWKERSDAKKSSVLNGVPTQFIHPELEFSTTDTSPLFDIPGKYLSAEQLSITSLDAVDIVRSISKGTLSAVQVLDAFTHRAAIAHKLLNCCLEFRYQDARKEAERLDDLYQKTGKTLGPLHGLPISVKDQCRIIGTETTCGFVAGIGLLDEDDCTLVQILQRAGAVIFVKTNLSFGCMWGETINKCVLGYSLSPDLKIPDTGHLASSGEQAIHSIVLFPAVARVVEKEPWLDFMEAHWALGPTWEVPFAGKSQVPYAEQSQYLT